MTPGSYSGEYLARALPEARRGGGELLAEPLNEVVRPGAETRLPIQAP